MKILSTSPLLLGLALARGISSAVAQGTAFHYQGRFTDNGSPANGAYDLRFVLYDAASAGQQIGPTLPLAAVPVTNGLFNVALDFGAGAFNGDARWLELGVRAAGSLSNFTTLAPRQALLPTPYAIRAGQVSAAGLTGTLPQAALPTNVARLDTSPVFTGPVTAPSFAGNGAQLTSLNPTAIGPPGTFTFLSPSFGFSPAFSMAVGAEPYFHTVVDVNGDGWPDLAVPNYEGDSITVLTNNRQGGLVLAATVALAGGPLQINAADVNGDGWADLIVLNFGSGNQPNGSMVVLTNDSRGGFAVSMRYDFADPSFQSQLQGLAIADFNHDGRVDFACGMRWYDTVYVFTNHTAGRFSLASTSVVSSYVVGLVAPDVNRDGWADLVSANWQNGTLSVMTNDHKGAFGLATNLTVGAAASTVTSADVNGDGWPDLISSDSTQQPVNALTVFLNDGRGGFIEDARLLVPGKPADGLAVADLNGDGWVDLVSANAGNDTCSVFTNNGRGKFTLAATLAVGSTPINVVAVDLNRDGLPDLVTANLNADTISVLMRGTAQLEANFGRVTAGSFAGNGQALTNLSASSLTGTIAKAQLPANLARTDGNPVFTGDVRITGLLRSGSETGTAEAPSPAGLVVRRINTSNTATNQVVARAGALTLMRDGTSGGFLLRYPASPGSIAVACLGVNAAGAPLNFVTTLANPASAGAVAVLTDAQNAAHFQASFGLKGSHLTQLTLTRFDSGYWAGTVISTFNQ